MPMFPLMFLQLRYIIKFSDLHEGVFQAVVSWVLTPCRMKWILMFRGGGGMVFGIEELGHFMVSLDPVHSTLKMAATRYSAN